MNEMLDLMIEKYHPKTNVQRINVIKQVLQEIALSGLSKSHFFDHAAFYGGTSLRIVYGLNRFSEDLDFALIDSDPNFNLDSYFPALVQEFNHYGININVETKEKLHSTGVQSAFIKTNTLMLMLNFYPSIKESNKFVFNQKIKIKFEIDLSNPPGGKTEIRSLTNPNQCQI